MPTFTAVVETIGLAIDGAGVAVIAIGLIVAVVRYALGRGALADPYRQLRHDVGKAILLGLEFLVAADIIRTVAVAPTMDNALTLGVIVLIRTFLSMAVQVELEGHWPWRRAGRESAGP